MIEALKEYAAIVKETREEYTQEELTISIIRKDHPELNFMDDKEIQEIIDFANRGREENSSQKWYVSVEPQKDGRDYVGINEYYGGEENEPGFIAMFDSEQDADDFCSVYAAEHNLPTFAEYMEAQNV